MEFIRKVQENGKLTIPKEIRELHGIKEGDFVQFRVVQVLPQSAKRDDDGLPDASPDLPGARSAKPETVVRDITVQVAADDEDADTEDQGA